MKQVTISRGTTVKVEGITKPQKIECIYNDDKYGLLIVSVDGHQFTDSDIREVEGEPVYKRVDHDLVCNAHPATPIGGPMCSCVGRRINKPHYAD